MNQNKLTFELEELAVDWIGFKFQNLDNFAQTKLAEYLFEIGFNSYQESGKLAKPVKESIFVSSKNKFQVLFVHEAPYWKGTYVHFSGAIDEKSLIEAKGGLQGEAQGMYKDLRRPSNKDVDLDFEIDSSKGYTHVDYKTPIDFDDLAEKKGIDVSNFPSLETVAYNMGKKIPAQKKEFCGLPGGPETPENVLDVVNLDLIRDSNQKQNMINNVLNGAEDKGSDAAGIYFLNYL